MDLSALFSDDQVAFLGCFAALAVCGGIAALSFKFGPANKSQATASVRFRRASDDSSREKSTRKAA